MSVPDFRSWRLARVRCVQTGLLVACSTLVIAAADAQVERSGGGASAQLIQQYQQVLAQRTQLQADNDKLKKELDDTSKQLKEARQQLAALKSGGATQEALSAAQATAQNATKALEQSKARMKELIDRFRETATNLKEVETERSRLERQQQLAQAAMDQCTRNNAQLYQINSDVLDRLEHQGLFSHLAASEPFTRIKRTQNENLAYEDHQRAESLRVPSASEPSAGSTASEIPGATKP
jgi:colicin import membrane protein